MRGRESRIYREIKRKIKSAMNCGFKSAGRNGEGRPHLSAF